MADNTLIIGNGACAVQTADHLIQHGLEVILASEQNDVCSAYPDLLNRIETGASEILKNSRLIACKGRLGAFHVDLEQNGKRFQRDVAVIVIAAENDRRSNIGRYGLQPTDKTVSLETLNSLLADSPRSLLYKTVAFINGLHAENLPQVFSDMASAALRLRTSLATRTYFLTRNVKVAGNGLEALFREAKQAGVFFFKLSESGWKMEHSNPGGGKN